MKKIKKNIQKGKTSAFFEKYKTLTFFLLIIALMSAFFYFSWDNDKIDSEIKISFSNFKAHETNATALAIYYPSPNIDFGILESFLEKAEQNNMPITFFLTPRSVSLNATIEEVSALILEEPTNDIDIDKLKSLIEKYHIDSDFSIGGYADFPYDQIKYKFQEDLIMKTKKAFSEKGIEIDGFIPPKSSYSFDTVLAAENNQIDYIVLTTSNETEPLHPESVVGGKMRIMIFPIRQKLIDGFNLVLLTEEDINDPEIGIFLSQLKKVTDVRPLKEIEEQIREIESIKAQIITDMKEGTSTLSMTGLTNNTKIIFMTDLDPVKIFDVNQNSTIKKFQEDNGFYLLVNESSNIIEITWKEE